MRSLEDAAPAPPVSARCARLLHWSTVVLLGVQIGVQIPVGLFMVRYGAATDFAAPSGILYDGHKLGLLILLLAAARLAYRLAHGAPPSEWRFPTMDRSGPSALRLPCSPRRTATGQNVSLPIIASPPRR